MVRHGDALYGWLPSDADANEGKSPVVLRIPPAQPPVGAVTAHDTSHVDDADCLGEAVVLDPVTLEVLHYVVVDLGPPVRGEFHPGPRPPRVSRAR